MNIIKTDVDDLNALLKVELSKDDYLPQVDQSLKKIRKTAQMKGFRPGKVPIGLVKKMYGNNVLMEEIDKLINKSVGDFIKEQEIKILGRPVFVPDENLRITLDNPIDIEFNYELGIAPKFDIDIEQKDNPVNKHKIEVDDSFIETELNQLRRRFGKSNVTEPPIEEKDILNVKFEELDGEGNLLEEGSINDTSIAVDMIKDEKLLKKVLKLKIDETIDMDLESAFDRDKASILKHLINKEVTPDEDAGTSYKMTVTGINRIELADMNQDFFNQVYGEGTVDSEEAFMEKFKGDIDELANSKADQRLKVDIYKQLMESVQVDFPDDFLKKFIKQNNEKPLTDDELEDGFDKFKEELKWSLIREKIMAENEIKVEQEEIMSFAVEDVRKMYRQYMRIEVSDEEASQYAMSMMKDQKYLEETYGRILEEKLFDLLSERFAHKESPISFDEFNKLN